MAGAGGRGDKVTSANATARPKSGGASQSAPGTITTLPILLLHMHEHCNWGAVVSRVAGCGEKSDLPAVRVLAELPKGRGAGEFGEDLKGQLLRAGERRNAD